MNYFDGSSTIEKVSNNALGNRKWNYIVIGFCNTSNN